MTTAAQLYRLNETTVTNEYVEALFGDLKKFLRGKQQGHCQRVDYLPRPVMERLGQCLSTDTELVNENIICRVLTDRPQSETLELWQVRGSGAVALREDATYKRIKVFCALFPSGIRLAEEDSLNVATFKTDDAESFDADKCIRRHLRGKVNRLPQPERDILLTILDHDRIRGIAVRKQLSYVLGVLGQRQQSGSAVNWEVAGAYLYELGLIPDFGLDEGRVQPQLGRNETCIKIVTDGQRELMQNLQTLRDEMNIRGDQLVNGLAVCLADRNPIRPETWLPDICHDDQTRDRLSFDVWDFANPVTEIRIELDPLKKGSRIASGLVEKSGMLVNDGIKPISIKWKVEPADTQDIGGYRVYIIRTTEEDGEQDVISPQNVPAKRKSFKVPVADNNLEEGEKCVVRIRIQALDTNGASIPNAVDESEEFWIENGDEILEPPKERGTRIEHALELIFRETFKSGKVYEIRHRGWDLKREHVYGIRLTNNERGDLVLTPLLKNLERRILENPNTLGILEANLVNRRRATLDDFRDVSFDQSVQQMANTFWKARENLFTTIRDFQDGTGVVEIADLHAHEALVQEYVQSYLGMLKQLQEEARKAKGPGAINGILHDFAPIMRIDTVHLCVGPADRPMEVLLLAPTHPLRILWLFQFETYVQGWIDKMDGKEPEEIRRLIAQDSISKILNLNIPNAVSWRKDRTFINTDRMGLFWTVFPDANIQDLRTAVNAAFQALGSGQQAPVISTITPKQIADKMERYLCHHPYVRTLKINVVNPGDGALLLDAIKKLLEKDLYREMNFDLKFFAPVDTLHQLVGNALDDFMQQKFEDEFVSSANLSETEERLLKPNENPLFPKLVYAKHDISELLEDDNLRFQAHLTLVIDFFGITISTRPHTGASGSSSIHNLLAEYVTDYTPGQTTATWSRMIAPNSCPDLASDGITPALFESHDGLSRLASCFYDWNQSLEKYNTVQLELTDDHDKWHFKMLSRVHYLSDWVFTIDRNFGIEYYDDPIRGAGAREAGGYLIDYSPEFLDAVSHRLIISTYHQREIESILRQGFVDMLKSDEDEGYEVIDSYRVGVILNVLKSVSGKLALKLINNPKQASEVIGLALTRLALERQGRLKGAVLIPVDSHISLFYQTQRELEDSDLTLKRTDLMLARLEGRRLHIDLIEVKNRKYSSPAAKVELQEAIREKNQNTESHFRANFLGTGEQRRFDADIRNKEFANILAFYFERACRYGLFVPRGEGDESDVSQFVAGGEALESQRVAFLDMLQAVAAGSCELSFGHEGFIFNASALGGEERLEVLDNAIFTYGKQGIGELIGVVFDRPDDEEDEGTPAPAITPPTEPGPGSEIVAGEAEEEPATETSEAGVSVVDSREGPSGTRSLERTVEEASGASSEVDVAARSADVAQGINVYLGKDLTTNRGLFWNPLTKIPTKLTNQHLLIVGTSGAGKSETTKAMIWELDKRGVPTIILDFQGEYASGDFYDAVEPQVYDVMQGLPINPFEVPIDPITGQRRPYIEMVYRLADTLNTVFRGSGDIQLGLLRDAITECYIQKGFKPNKPDSWNNAAPTIEMLEKILDLWADGKGAQVRNLKVRLQPLFQTGIFQSSGGTFNFDDLLKRTSVIKLTAAIKDLMLAASRFLLEKIYATMLAQGLSKDLKLMVCIDEAHKVCGDETITSLVKEARKYGLGLILSSQETRDFHESIFANTGTLIALALEDADATVMVKHLGLTDANARRTAKDILLNQASGEALIRSKHFQPYKQVKIQSFEDRRR